MRTINIFLALVIAFTNYSCSERGLLEYEYTGEIPDMIDLELDQADDLKNYINRENNPNFILAAGGVDAQTFISKGVEYALICANFEEITPGNAFKYASVVDNNGNMDFSEVKQIIQTAKEADLSVYGHTLCWHKQQRGSYFESKMNDAIKNVEGDSGGETLNNYCMQIQDLGSKIIQPNYLLDNTLNTGDFTISLRVRQLQGPEIEDFRVAIQHKDFNNPPSSVGKNMVLTSDWQNYEHTFQLNTDNHFQKILLQFNSTSDTNTIILVDDITLKEADGTVLLSIDFENEDISKWKALNCKISSKEEDISIPPTIDPEEEKEIRKGVMLKELDKWVKGMFEACVVDGSGYVKHWDAVNEPMSDKEPTQLKSIALDGDENGTRFYWQEYLGKNYARYVIDYARKYFQESGGNPDELVLFVNDYGLESKDGKCQGLIDMIEYWESDNKTVIDGIGTQMHVTYSLKPETQAKNEEKVVEMFNKLAASDKIIKISELDMGIKDESGTELTTGDLTYEMHEKMADYYEFIVSKYFEIIPKEKQYGIAKWRILDAEETGWRANCPIGLWNKNFERKPAYLGFAKGLIKGTQQ